MGRISFRPTDQTTNNQRLPIIVTLISEWSHKNSKIKVSRERRHRNMVSPVGTMTRNTRLTTTITTQRKTRATSSSNKMTEAD
jgi:hypothetical protein